jgi:hypothetical protein
VGERRSEVRSRRLGPSRRQRPSEPEWPPKWVVLPSPLTFQLIIFIFFRDARSVL